MVKEVIVRRYSFLRPKGLEEWSDKAIKARTLREAYIFAATLGFKKEELEVLGRVDLLSPPCLNFVIEPSLEKEELEMDSKLNEEVRASASL